MDKMIQSNIDVAGAYSSKINFPLRVDKLAEVNGDTTPVEGKIVESAEGLRDAMNSALDQLNKDADNILELAKLFEEQDKASSKYFDQ